MPSFKLQSVHRTRGMEWKRHSYCSCWTNVETTLRSNYELTNQLPVEYSFYRDHPGLGHTSSFLLTWLFLLNSLPSFLGSVKSGSWAQIHPTHGFWLIYTSYIHHINITSRFFFEKLEPQKGEVKQNMAASLKKKKKVNAFLLWLLIDLGRKL